ncbi:MAG: hypothetical protein WKF90_06455 [Pyrinomonadaceae bacterium]|jgi:uncharacterized membrane protein SirB2|nr:hypothetical protein [Acidobacteriota bacterium]
MWNKVYLGILGLMFILMSVLTYLTFSWLQSVDKPTNVVANYEYNADISRTFLWISSIILLILANILFWQTRKSWALWATLLYFAAFTAAQTFWLSQTFFQYQQDKNLTADNFSFGSPFAGAMMIGLAGIFVFFNQYLVKRLYDKTFASQTPAAQMPDEILVDENKV